MWSSCSVGRWTNEACRIISPGVKIPEGQFEHLFYYDRRFCLISRKYSQHCCLRRIMEWTSEKTSDSRLFSFCENLAPCITNNAPPVQCCQKFASVLRMDAGFAGCFTSISRINNYFLKTVNTCWRSTLHSLAINVPKRPRRSQLASSITVRL